jgi:hypothetical protein
MAMCFPAAILKQHPIAKNEIRAYLLMGERTYCRSLFISILQPAIMQGELDASAVRP